jgi:MoxR-like ATPase
MRGKKMQEIFITKIEIEQVRHLTNLVILLSDAERKHLILTGKNGSGKTSVLEALRTHIDPPWVTDVHPFPASTQKLGKINISCNSLLSGLFIIIPPKEVDLRGYQGAVLR